MRRDEYYLIWKERGNANIIYGPCDISEIDIFTLQFTKSEFLKYYNLNEEYTDLYLLKKKQNENGYYLKFYDCIFKPNYGNSIFKIIHCLEEFAKIRRSKYHMVDAKSLKIDEHPAFSHCLKILLNNIVSDTRIQNKITSEQSIAHFKLKEKIKGIKYSSQFNEYFLKYNSKILSNYKELRGLIMEYMQSLFIDEIIIKRDNNDRLNANYESALFDYHEPFFINVFNASADIVDKKLGQVVLELQYNGELHDMTSRENCYKENEVPAEKAPIQISILKK